LTDCSVHFTDDNFVGLHEALKKLGEVMGESVFV
jgi:hypothetical protein